MSDFQEPSGPTPAGLLFLLTALPLAVLLYGYLLVLRYLPGPVLEAAPPLPTLPLALSVAALLYLSPRVRRAPWVLRVLPVAAALAALPFLPGSLPLVSPLAGLRVHRVFAETAQLRLLLPTLLHAVAAAVALAFVPAALLRRQGPSRIPAVAHGSARWGEERDARSAALLGPREAGVHLGYLDPGCRRPLTDASDHHVLVFAPPGVGKTTALVIPTLLHMEASAWVLDPKGELWDATAEWRRRELRHRCVRYAPTDPASPAWNPLAEIPLGAGDIATASLLARNLVVAPVAGAERHWTLAARSLWTLLALHVCWAPNVRPTMASLRSVLSSQPDHDALFDQLATFQHDEYLKQGWLDPVTGEPSATHPEVRLLAKKFRGTPGRERGSVISTLAQYLDPWGDPQIARATGRSELSLTDLLDGGRTTVYLSIPFHDLGRLSPLIRLQLAALGRRLTERPPGKSRRLELVVDEFASLGRVPILQELLAYFRGYDTRAFLLCQDLAQVRRLYGANETISGNCRVHLTTATQSPGTRRHASSLAGVTTARYRRVTRAHGLSKGGGRRTSAMVEASRPLITEGEVGTLDLDRALVFKAGRPPLKSYLRPYFLDPELRRRTLRQHPGTPGQGVAS